LNNVGIALGFLNQASRDSLERHLASIGRLLYALNEWLEGKVRRGDAEP